MKFCFNLAKSIPGDRQISNNGADFFLVSESQGNISGGISDSIDKIKQKRLSAIPQLYAGYFESWRKRWHKCIIF